MDEQTYWKGHTFTLMIFGGIVVLCSIFFVLGMLVGRTQGQKLAIASAAEAAAKAVSRESEPAPDPRPDLSLYDSVEKNKQPELQTSIPKPEPPPVRKVEEPAGGANVIHLQIIALKKSADAEKMVDELKKKGFRAFVLAPPPGETNRLYRVQVGPIGSRSEADSVKAKLEAAGYKPIVK